TKKETDLTIAPGATRGTMSILTRAVIATLPRRRLHGGRNPSKAVVDLVETDGRAVVLKDVAPRSWPVRAVIGPWQLDRETRAYRALEGVRGIPALVARVDRQAIGLEYVPGRNLAFCRRGDLPASFFDALDRLLDAVHARGVAHGDLHRHDVLSGPGGEPYLVDWSTGVVAAPGAGPWSRFLSRQMCLADRRSAAKLRRRLLPGGDADVPRRPWLYRAGRWVKRLLALARPDRRGGTDR